MNEQLNKNRKALRHIQKELGAEAERKRISEANLQTDNEKVREEDDWKIEADNSPVTQEERKEIEEALECVKNGETIAWEDIQREMALKDFQENWDEEEF